MTPNPARILIVDDEPAIRQFLRISLGSQGFRISEASTGDAAIRTVREMLPADPIDLILLDLGLPDSDGQQVLSTLRQQVSLPIIIVSVRGQETEKVRALDNGANDYVTKPFWHTGAAGPYSRPTAPAPAYYRNAALSVWRVKCGYGGPPGDITRGDDPFNPQRVCGTATVD